MTAQRCPQAVTQSTSKPPINRGGGVCRCAKGGMNNIHLYRGRTDTPAQRFPPASFKCRWAASPCQSNGDSPTNKSPTPTLLRSDLSSSPTHIPPIPLPHPQIPSAPPQLQEIPNDLHHERARLSPAKSSHAHARSLQTRTQSM